MPVDDDSAAVALTNGGAGGSDDIRGDSDLNDCGGDVEAGEGRLL